MTLHEDWHKAHPNYPCEYDTCPRGQALDLENATYTAAEVKVLTEEACKVTYALGRKQALDEVAGALIAEGATQRAIAIVRAIQAQDATSERTDPTPKPKTRYPLTRELLEASGEYSESEIDHLLGKGDPNG